MTKIFALISLSLNYQWAKACPVCEVSQPGIFKGITHGTGPQSNWDFVIIAATAVVVLICLFLSIHYLYKPGETNKSHIKNSIFNTEAYGS